jgi:hypothetical protein
MEAARAYDEAARRIKGDGAKKLNFPESSNDDGEESTGASD